LKNGKVFLVGNVVVGSANPNDETVYGQLLLIAEEQGDGTFRLAFSGLPEERYNCRYFNHADLDGDGVDEIVLSCINSEMPESYSLLKRKDGRWKIEF
jgi:hypothetical protein